MAKYTSSSQQTLLSVVEVLACQPLRGMSLAEVLDGAKHSSSAPSRDQIFRALKNLAEAGWAEQERSGDWRLTPKLAFVSERCRLAIGDLHRTYLGGQRP